MISYVLVVVDLIGSEKIVSYEVEVAGFTKHTFTDDLTNIQTDFIDIYGNILHTVNTENKNEDN